MLYDYNEIHGSGGCKSYDKKVSRWGIGLGYVLRRERPDYAEVYDRTSKDPDGLSGFLRASVRRLGKKNFKVVLFQGRDHKDTIYKTNRWMNVRETIGNHLCDIDRYLERPLTKFRMPTEEECFGPRVGDVIVYTDSYEPLHGSLGEIVGVPGDTFEGVTNVDYSARFYDSGLDDVKTFIIRPSNYEIIDHIDEPDFKINPPDQSVFKRASEELLEQKHQEALKQMHAEADKLIEELPKIPVSQRPQTFEDDGWEYWLERYPKPSDPAIHDTGVVLWRKCMHCGKKDPRSMKTFFK